MVIDDHFLEHKKRREKLIKNYCMTRFGKSDIKYLLALENNTNKEIAKKLHISIKTVETHRRQIMKKLNIFSVAELTKYAVRKGLTSLDG